MTTMTSQFARTETSRGQFVRSLRARFARIAAWLETCADYYAAAAMYEQLSRLSDAELQRRGLSRDSLARDACASAERQGKE